MNTPANHTTRASHSGSVPAVQETSYLRCPEGRIGYDVAGDGALVILVPGMGDLRAGYRFLAPALRAAGYRVACTDLRGHGDSDATFTSYGDEETAGDVIALLEELGGPAVVVGNSMGAGSAVLAAAERPDITAGVVLSFLESVNGPAQARLIRPGMSAEAGRIAGEAHPVAGPEVTAASSLAPPLPGPAAQ
jgi:pimeloyl-ACP methyl ester carboxylesterase